MNHQREWKLLGAVLDRFNLLEASMTRIIVAYVRPAEGRGSFLANQILHNVNVSFGAKVRLILSVSRETGGPKLSRDKLHKLLNIRNALAHGDSASALRVNRNALRVEPYGEYLVIQTIKGDGSVEEKPRATAIAEFMTLIEDLQSQLDALAERVNRHAT